MRVSLLFTSLLASVGLVSAGRVSDDVNQLSGLLKQLAGDVDAFDNPVNSLAFALQVQIDAVNIDKVLRDATTALNAGGPLGGDSLGVSATLLSASGDVKTGLSNISKKARAFSYLSPIVLKSLYALKQSTRDFGNALVPKLGALEAGVAPGVLKDLQSEFDDAIKAYGGNTSGLTAVVDVFSANEHLSTFQAERILCNSTITAAGGGTRSGPAG